MVSEARAKKLKAGIAYKYNIINSLSSIVQGCFINSAKLYMVYPHHLDLIRPFRQGGVSEVAEDTAKKLPFPSPQNPITLFALNP